MRLQYLWPNVTRALQEIDMLQGDTNMLGKVQH